MASTGKTPHLGLNQWVLDDPFLMEDMNQDNLLIDTAMAGLELRKNEFVLLKDITTTAQAEEVSMDISDVHMEDYSLIVFCVNRLGSGSAGLAFYPCQSQSLTTPGYGSGSNRYHCGLGSDGQSNILLMFPMKDGTAPLSSFCPGVGGNYICNGRSDKGYYGETTQMKILPDNTGYYTKAGTQIRIWGMK